MIFLFSWVISRFHVTFPGCSFPCYFLSCTIVTTAVFHLSAPSLDQRTCPRSKPGFQVLRRMCQLLCCRFFFGPACFSRFVDFFFWSPYLDLKFFRSQFAAPARGNVYFFWGANLRWGRGKDWNCWSKLSLVLKVLQLGAMKGCNAQHAASGIRFRR